MVTIGARDLPRSMKNSYGRCRVLSQQTILNFNEHPPSVLGAQRIPLCVTEERAGERRFAMATETQLRFNLDVPPVPTNLASNVQPQPSPVVIDKPAGMRACVQTPNAPANPGFSERLALAIKLARRDLRNGLIGPHLYCVTGEVQPEAQTHPSTPFVSWQAYTGAAPQIFATQQPPPTRTQTFDAAHVGISAGYRAHPESPAPGGYRAHPEAPPAGEDRRATPQLKHVTDEIVRLRKELTAEVKKLKQLKMGNQGNGMKEVRSARPSDDADFKRQGWEAKENEEGRLKRKIAEQTARNTRMLYDLQQQVSELQKDAGEKPPNVRHTKKSLAMQRLAAAHKAVLGTLQSHFSACVSAGHSRPIPAELALLVERLVLLGTQLHIDGDQGELLEGIKDLGLGRDCTHTETSLRPKWKKATGSLGNPSHSGRKKRSIKQAAAVSIPPKRAATGAPKRHTVGERTKVSAGTVHTNTTREKPLYSNKGRNPTGHKLPTSPPSSSLFPASPLHHVPTSEADKGKALKPVSPSYTRGRALEPMSLSCATQTRHEAQDVDELRKWVELELQGLNSRLDRSKQPQPKADSFTSLEPGAHPKSSRARGQPVSRNVEPRPACVLDNPLREAAHNPLMEAHNPLGEAAHNPLREAVHNGLVESAHEGTKSQVLACANHQAKVMQHMPDLQAMLAQLEEFEAEEEMIRQRWTSLAYEDPYHQTETEASINHQPSSQPLSVPATTLASIQQYRATHEHYLELTGIRTTGNFDPWKLVESIADQLLDEQLGLVAAELADVCDKCVDGLYTAEFTVPMTTRT